MFCWFCVKYFYNRLRFKVVIDKIFMGTLFSGHSVVHTIEWMNEWMDGWMNYYYYYYYTTQFRNCWNWMLCCLVISIAVLFSHQVLLFLLHYCLPVLLTTLVKVPSLHEYTQLCNRIDNYCCKPMTEQPQVPTQSLRLRLVGAATTRPITGNTGAGQLWLVRLDWR